MQTKEYQVVNGTYYSKNLQYGLVMLLEKIRGNRDERVLIVYGDTETGVAWPDVGCPVRGSIGRSPGPKPIPLLIKTRRSLGGVALMDDNILQVRTSRGAVVLWTHDNYR